MVGAAREDGRAVFEIALVVAVAVAAIAAALYVATDLPTLTIAVGAAVLWTVAVVVIALVAG